MGAVVWLFAMNNLHRELGLWLIIAWFSLGLKRDPPSQRKPWIQSGELWGFCLEPPSQPNPASVFGRPQTIPTRTNGSFIFFIFLCFVFGRIMRKLMIYWYSSGYYFVFVENKNKDIIHKNFNEQCRIPIYLELLTYLIIYFIISFF